MAFVTDPAGACPRCGMHPERTAMPRALKWVRIFFHEASFRACFCGWRGLRMHNPRVSAGRVQRSA